MVGDICSWRPGPKKQSLGVQGTKWGGGQEGKEGSQCISEAKRTIVGITESGNKMSFVIRQGTSSTW